MCALRSGWYVGGFSCRNSSSFGIVFLALMWKGRRRDFGSLLISLIWVCNVVGISSLEKRRFSSSVAVCSHVLTVVVVWGG